MIFYLKPVTYSHLSGSLPKPDHYTYCADGDSYELNAALESDQLKSKVFMDGGNAMDKYEVGSDLNLIASTGGSCEY